MRNIARSIACAFLVSAIPFAAHASLFTLEYSGRLTDRYTHGFDFADHISGTLTFDLASGADIYPDDEFSSEYRIVPGATDFVTGYVTPHLGINDDLIRFYNGYGEPDNPMPAWDAFNIYDASVVAGGKKDAIFLSVEIEHLDWLSNDSVKEFTFSGAQLNKRLTAVLLSGRQEVYGGDTYYYPLYDAYYELDFVKLKAVAVDVPELGSLYLILIGGLALLVRRRQLT